MVDSREDSKLAAVEAMPVLGVKWLELVPEDHSVEAWQAVTEPTLYS